MPRRVLPKLHGHRFGESAILGETAVGPICRGLVLFPCRLLPFLSLHLRLTGPLWLLVRV